MSKNTEVASIIGRSVQILVAEPWDFSSSDGDNLLKGTIALESDPGSDERGWLLLEVTPFQLAGAVATYLMATTRYVGEALPGAELRAKGRVTCNLAVPVVGIGATQADVERVRKAIGGLRFAMIGSISW